MANSYFTFKEFTIQQDKCAMKVGTDGVLLGAWTNTNKKNRILDIGTGTGLIALMLAQRTEALIDAIDIDYDAYRQAKENVSSSPYPSRITIFHESLASFKTKTSNRYDLIVSNPPYFTQSLKSPIEKKNIARHADNNLPLEKLINDSKTLLNENGSIALILPYDQEEQLKQIIKQQFYFTRRTEVIPVIGKMPKRILVELSQNKDSQCTSDTLTIEESRHLYTKEYIELTQDFYLSK